MKIKFICLNMWQGGIMMDNILQFLHEEKPDILALQEVYDGKEKNLPRQYRTLELLARELPFLKHSHFAPAFLDQKEIGQVEQGNAVFSRFPILQTAITFADVPYSTRLDESNVAFTPRNLQQVTIDFLGNKIHVFNIQGIWGTDGADNDRRLAMADMIVSQLKEKESTILCGDFNVQMATRTIQKLEVHLQNVFRGKLTSSFNMRHKTNPAFASAVVDTIFIGSDFTLIDARAPDNDVSDHLPLVTELLLGSKK